MWCRGADALHFGSAPGAARYDERAIEQSVRGCGAAAMRRTVEIRTYRLKTDAKPRFHQLVATQSVPLLQRWRIDVVAFGPSCDADEGYVLIRAYSSAADMHASQDAFYASAEWHAGPRQAVLELIESHTSVVLDLDASVVDALRAVFL